MSKLRLRDYIISTRSLVLHKQGSRIQNQFGLTPKITFFSYTRCKKLSLAILSWVFIEALLQTDIYFNIN